MSENIPPNDRPKIVDNKAEEAHRLFDFLEENSVDFVVVGDVREYETEIDSDIDIFVTDRDLLLMPSILREYCLKHKGRLVQVIRYEASAWCFDLYIDVDNLPVFISVDVCSNFVFSARHLVDGNFFLKKRIQSATNFWIPAPANGFIYYFLKKIGKKDINDRQLTYLSELRRQEQLATDGFLRKELTSKISDRAINAIACEDLLAFNSISKQLHKELISKKTKNIMDLVREFLRLSDRATRPTGVMLGFLGPDGVGKSSVIEGVERQIGPAFRKQARFHLRPHFGKPQGTSVTVEDPHSGQPRGLSGSMAKLALWWLDYVSGYVRGVYPKLIRSTLVVFDRYADDLAVDPKRYRYGGPLWMARLLGRTVPRPDLMFVLVADPEIIQARKAEVPLAETSRQVEEYRKLAQRKGVILVDAGRPLEEVVSNIVEETLTWMEKRTHKRLGLKP
jgi:thymidylate kinase